MNASCYKVIFSKRHGILVAVGEHAAAQGKAAGACNRSVAVNIDNTAAVNLSSFIGLVKALVASSVLACTPALNAYAAGPAANALPTNGVVQTGAANISTSGANMTINQGTDKASINWGSFNIGSGAAVNVQQNSASSVLLNRVIGNDASQIFGKLSANGQVILINPNGIVFGKGGSVTASAFTASTFGMTDKDFQAGQYKYNRNGSTAGVSVEDSTSIQTTTPGGYVALMGASVNNQGHISTQQGAVVMAAGESVALPQTLTHSVGIPLSSKVRLEIAPSSIAATVDNGGVITTEGGQVLMQASSVVDAVSRVANASVSNTGSIDTSAAQGGAVSLQAEGGQIKVAGSIKADSTQAGNKGGDVIIGRDEQTGALAHNTDVSQANIQSNKGFVETSGEHLTVDGIQIQAGEWLLDPTDITISASATTAVDDNASPTRTFSGAAGTSSSVVQASTIGTALSGGTSVTIKTSSSANGTATGDADGNITVTTGITQTGNNTATLTLLADNGITVNSGANITGSTTGKLNVVMTSFGATKGTNNTANAKGISLNANITTHGGNVTLTDNGTVGVKLGDSVASTIDTRLDTTKAITDSSNASAGDLVVQSKGSTSGPIIVGNGGALTVYARNIALDQTGGSVNSSTGAITTGTSRAASGASGVLFSNGGSRLNAASNIYAAGNALAGRGVYLGSNAVLTAGGTVSLVGDSLNSGYGVMIGGYQFQAPTVTAGTINVQGNVTTALGSTGYGIYSNRWASGAQQLSATGSINLEGTVSGAGSGSGIAMGTSGWNIGYIKLVAGGDITVRGNTRTSASDTSVANNIAGLQVFAGDVGIGGSGATGNINILGETLNASANAILVSQNQQPGSAYQSYFSANGGNLLFQGNKGTVQINGNTTSATLNATAGGVGMTAKNMTFDNTGAGMTVNGVVGTGSIDNATGAVTARGTGAATGGNGVSLLDTASSYQATGNINISGARLDTNSTAVSVATNLSAGGNLIAQSKGGQIYLSAGSVTGSGSSAVYSGGLIAGGNLTIDNRGSTIAADGSITVTGSANSGSAQAIVVRNGGLSTTGLLQIYGASGSSNGLSSSSLLQGGQLTIQATTNSSSTTAISLSGSNTRTTSSGTSTFTGSNASASGSSVYLGGTETFTVAAGATLTQSGSISSGTSSLVSNGAGTLNVTGSMSGSGSLSQSGTGTTILTGANSYTGATNVNAGTLQIGDGGTTGTLGTGTVTDNASLVFNRSNTLTVANNITGMGTLSQNGAGTTILKGTNSYDATNVNAGTLQVGDGGITGTLGTGTVTDNANLVFNRSNTLTVANSITGTGTLRQSGTGTTILTADNGYAGTTTISAGTLNVGNGGTTGTLGAGAVTNDATLIIDRTATTSALSMSTLAAGGITGTGKLTVKTGGALNINADITQNGASSTILLASGVGKAAGDETGGDVTISNNITTSSGGTVTVFSGSPSTVSTATQDAKITGATGATKYKTYNAVESDTSGTRTGTRNFYYRASPTLTVTETLASVTKTYDGTTVLGASDLSAFTGSKTTSGAIDGDTALNGNLSLTASGGTYGSKNVTGSSGQSVTIDYTVPTKTVGAWEVAGYKANSTNSKVVITAKQIVVADIGTINQKTYDGTTDALVTESSVTLLTKAVGTGTSDDNKLIAGDNVSTSLSGTLTGTYDTKNVAGTDVSGTNMVTFGGKSLQAGANGDDRANYNLVLTAKDGKNTIDKRTVTLTADAQSKTYDGGTTVASSSAYSVGTGSNVGFVGTEGVSGVSLAYTDKNASTTANKIIEIKDAVAASGTDLNNYNVGYVNNTASTISKRDVTLTASAQSKTYDGGTTVASSSAYSVGTGSNVGFVGTEGVSGVSLAYTDKNASTTANKIIEIKDAVAASGTDLNNYNVGYVNNAASTISKRTVTLTADAQSKTYDGGTTVASSSAYSVGTGSNVGFVGTEGVSGVSLAYTDKNASTTANKIIEIKDAVAASGTDLNNYNVGYVNNTASTISKRDVTLTASAQSKTYDGGTTVASSSAYSVGTGSNVGFVGTEGVSGVSLAYTDKNASTTANKIIEIKDAVAASGTDLNNYNVGYVNNTVSTIDKANLVLVMAAQSKTYDGTDAATIAAGSITANGVTVGGNTEKVSFNARTGTYNSKNVANATTVTTTVSSSDLDATTAANGWTASNYNTVAANTSVSNSNSTISKRTLTLTAATDTKTYDGGTSSVGVVSVTNKATPDTVVASQSYTDKNVAGTNGSTLQVSSGFTIKDANGADMTGNYVANTITATGTITPRSVTLSGVTVADKTFDGTTSATVSSKGTLASGLVSGESLGHTVGAAFNTAEAGTQKPVTLTAALQSTATGNANNYALVLPTVTATINAAAVKPPSPNGSSTGTDSRVKVITADTGGGGFSLASAEEEEDKTCSVNNLANCVCQDTTNGVQICTDQVK